MGWSQEKGRYGRGKLKVRREERCVHGLVGKLKGKGLIGRQRLRWGDNIKMEKGEMGWLWLNSSSKLKSGELLWKRHWTYMFHTTRGISGLAEDLWAGHGRLCSRELVGESVTGSRNLELSVADEVHTVKVRALRSEVQSLSLSRQSVKLATDKGEGGEGGGGAVTEFVT